MRSEIGASRRPAEDPGRESLTEAPPLVPEWVAELARERFRHVTVGFDGAREMDVGTFRRRVVEAYETIFSELESTTFAHPVRFWAFVPGIHDDLGAGLDRYMAYNTGRYAAFVANFGRPTSFDRTVPTASAVGVPGDRFELHCLAADEPGLPVENPRQVSAYHYSRRFGPLPPCFARATLVRAHTDRPMLLVGGTASITGEESRHDGALYAQAQETFCNLASLVASATGCAQPEETEVPAIEGLVAAFRELRVYYTDPATQGALAGLVDATFSSQCRVEWMQASLCRRELLVEIEGLAFPAVRRRES